MSTSHETILFVDLKALEHNYRYLKSKLFPNTEIIAVVKAFAYGHGDIEISKKLEKLGIYALWVTDFEEGVILRKAGIKSKIIVKPGEVTVIEYIVENLGDINTTGIATFAYFPNQFGNYVSKINCFCYDAQTLKPKQKSKYTLVLLIDPEVTKDSKTKDVKEVTIQFTFFDYEEYKKNES